MKHYTLKQKKYLLIRLIELHVFVGHSISGLVGKPLSYFNFEGVESEVLRYEEIYENQ